MSCYLRHMKDILEEAGIEVTPANKKQIDQAIHQSNSWSNLQALPGDLETVKAAANR